MSINMIKSSLFKAIIMLSILSVPFINIPTSSGESQDSIWDTEPKVHWGDISFGCWWLKGHREGVPKFDWRPAAIALNEAYLKNTSKLVRDYLVDIFVNDHNNTIFVVLKSMDTEITEGILEILNPSPGVSVKFRKSPASRLELEKWKQEIRSNKRLLEEKGVKIKTIIQTANGTILLGIDDLNIEKVKNLTDVLKGKVPPGILEIYKAGLTILEKDQDDAHRPLISGIEMQSYSLTTGNWTLPATLGFYVTWNNGNNHGMLTAAHVAQHEGTEDYQGGTLEQYKFGDTVGFAPGPNSDSALIEFDIGMSGKNYIWLPDDPIKVIHKKYSNDLFKGQTIKKVGVATVNQTGKIAGFGDWDHPLYETIENQVFANITSARGDSGSPYYTEIQIAGIKYAGACGIHVGRDLGLDQAVFSPIDGIEQDLGFTFNFMDSNKPFWTDDFNDNEREKGTWYKLEVNEGQVTETWDQLRLYIPYNEEGYQGIAGYSTYWKYPINSRYVEIDVTQFNDLDEMLLFIGRVKGELTDPWYQSEWYRCLKTKYSGYDYDWYIQKKMDGDITTIKQHSTSGSFKMRIAVDDGYILFYEDDDLRYVEEYNWVQAVHMYIYTATKEDRNWGLDYMDNFNYQKFNLDPHYWIDDFNDGEYIDEWTLDYGSASVTGGKLRISPYGQVTTRNPFGVDRYVRADVRTIEHGENHWEVALLQGKYENWNNQVYALLWPDGTVELAIRYGGYQNGWATGPGRVSNPDQEHKWEFIISGDYCILKIDDEIIFNKYHDNFGDIQGKVGLHANWPSTASFDNIVVID